MFIAQGVTLLVMEKPGGFVASQLGSFYLGDAIPSVLPMPIVLLAIVLLLWGWLKSTRFGAALYAIGSNSEAARSAGVRVDFTRFATYVIAGGCYGLAGVFISAQTGSGDPLVGNSMLLSIFAAVVLGGTRLGGGRGGPAGSVFGAYILMSVVNVLLVLNVSAYYSSIAEGIILILAVLAASLSKDSELAVQLRFAAARFSAWRAGALPRQIGGGDRRLQTSLPSAETARPGDTVPFWTRNAHSLRYALPFLRLLCSRRRRHGALAWQRGLALELLEFADRSVELPRHPRPGTRHRYSHRWPRSLRSLDDRAFRHIARGHGSRLGQGADLCAALCVRDRRDSSVSSTASASSHLASRQSS